MSLTRIHSEFMREKHMDKYFKKSESVTSTEMMVVHALNQNPVKTFRRADLPRFVNVGTLYTWDKFSTYEVYTELLKSSQELFGKCDKGLCAYLAQGLINPMYEAVVETQTDECDCTVVFGYDFETCSGDFYEAEEVMELILPYMHVCGYSEEESGYEYHVKLNVK